jgi:hypothetical protein
MATHPFRLLPYSFALWLYFEPRTVGQSPPATSSYIKKSRETSTYNRPNQRLGEQKKAKREKGQPN